MGISRRALLGAFALVGIPLPLRAQGESLATLGGREGLIFGSAVQAASLREPELMSLLARECASLTPELELKWAALSVEPNALDFSGADALAAFARSQGLRLRGHTLLWHQSLPAWFDHGTAWNVAERHIRSVVTRFAPLIDEWDVVNEPVVAGGLRRSPLLGAFGPEYVDRALHAAHEADPQARLIINEYDVEYSIPEQAERRAALLELVRSLLKRGAPLHGIGIQGHLQIGRGPLDPRVLDEFVREIGDLGLTVSITELDVKERDYILPAEERDRAVAEHAARFLETVLPHPAVHSLTCWGLSDRQSWLTVTDEDRQRFPGAWMDGSSPGLNRGLPYDASLQPKPMRQAIVGAMERRLA